MKPNEAIENIDNILSSPILCDESIDYQLTTDDIECLEMAKEVLEKQIPRKPIVDPANLCDFQNYHCPKCNKKIIARLDGEWIAGKLQKYCDDCGQALDWSDTE